MEATTTTKPDSKALILNLLANWIKQRPGLEYANYGDVTSYRAEVRSIGRDLADARTLLRAVELSGVTAETLRGAFRAFSGRLTLTETTDGRLKLDYCTGQYWPTEYRRAVCAVLAAALWDYYRDGWAEAAEAKGERAGDFIRAQFRRMFGRRMQQRWFD